MINTPTAELFHEYRLKDSPLNTGAAELMAFLDGEPLRALPGYINHYRNTALRLIQDELLWPKLPYRQKITMLQVLFLAISPEIQAIKKHPGVMQYIFLPPQTSLSRQQKIELVGNLDLEWDALQKTDEELVGIVSDSAFTLQNIASSFEHGDKWPCPPAQQVSFEEVAEACEQSRPSHHLWNRQKSDRLWRHRLIEVDIYRHPREILDSVKALVKKIQDELHAEEEGLDEDDIEEWAPPARRSNIISNALDAYFVIRSFGWREQEKSTRDMFKTLHDDEGLKKWESDCWNSLFKYLSKKGRLGTVITQEKGNRRSIKRKIAEAESIDETRQAVKIFTDWMYETDDSANNIGAQLNLDSVSAWKNRRQQHAWNLLAAIRKHKHIGGINLPTT